MVWVMIEEPLKKVSITRFKSYYKDKNSEQDIADAFALVSNKFFWVADNVDDHREGSKRYIEAVRISDEWAKLMNEYEAKIASILKRDGIKVPKYGRNIVYKPFMKKYGYVDGNGWWIKESECK